MELQVCYRCLLRSSVKQAGSTCACYKPVILTLRKPSESPSRPILDKHALSMLHCEPSWVPATCHLGSPISCVKFFFPTHLNNKKLLRCALHCLETRPTKLLGTLKNPNPFSCFVLTFLNHPTPFPPFLERTWAAQTPPDAYFLSLPKPFSSHSCEQ